MPVLCQKKGLTGRQGARFVWHQLDASSRPAQAREKASDPVYSIETAKSAAMSRSGVKYSYQTTLRMLRSQGCGEFCPMLTPPE